MGLEAFIGQTVIPRLQKIGTQSSNALKIDRMNRRLQSLVLNLVQLDFFTFMYHVLSLTFPCHRRFGSQGVENAFGPPQTGHVALTAIGLEA